MVYDFIGNDYFGNSNGNGELMADYVHGELIGASTGTLTLYDTGTTDARVLDGAEQLYITDAIIYPGATGTFYLYADALAAGKYIVTGDVDASYIGPIIVHFVTPYICPVGLVPKFSGVSNDTSVTIQGYIPT